MTDADPNDDDVIEFYLSQSRNRSERTTPMSEAENAKKTTKPADEFVCEKCNFRTNRKDILSAHMSSNHNAKTFKCDKCDFKAKTEAQLKKHFDVRHKDNPVCRYWRSVVCMNTFCNFEHPASQKSAHKNIDMYYQGNYKRTERHYSQQHQRSSNEPVKP